MNGPSDVAPLPVLSICSGSAALEEGLAMAGFPTRPLLLVEREAFSVSYLASQMANQRLDPAPVWSDVETVPEAVLRSLAGIPGLGIVGGIPCQPWSSAGKRKRTADDRWIWTSVERIIRLSRPEWIFLEEVTGIVTGGLEHILRSMAEAGLDAEWGTLQAADAGAPHKRERLFVLGVHPGSQRVSDALRHALRYEPERRRRPARQTHEGNPESRNLGRKEVGHADGERLPVGRGATGQGGDRLARDAGDALAVAELGGFEGLGTSHDVDRSDAPGDVVDGLDQGVGLTDGARLEGGEGDDPHGRREVAQVGHRAVANAENGDGRSGVGAEEAGAWENGERGRGSAGRCPDFPPGPNADWSGIPLCLWPALTRAEEAQLEVRELVDGPFLDGGGATRYALPRVDVLRLEGNSVVPQQVAMGLLVLAERILQQ